MILVVGATGNLGSEICTLLTAKGHDVRAMVRKTSDKTKTSALKQKGVELCIGDLRKPSTFELALAGIETVITTVSAMPFSYVPGENTPEKVDKYGMINFIDYAKKAGVKNFIYTSFSGNINEEFPLRNAKRTVESYLIKSGMRYTILRPGYFMEAWFTATVGFDIKNHKVQLCGNGNIPVSYISMFDVAKFAVHCVQNPLAKNATLELGGPDKISQIDAVKIFENVIGIPFEISNTPIEALRSNMRISKDPMDKSLAGLMLCLAKGDSIDMKKTLKRFPLKLTSVKEYARNAVASLVH